jgi:DNA-binding response OmpR family regulator
MNILLIEDEKRIRDFVCCGFREQGFVVDCCDNGDEGYQKARSREYSAIVLDIMLPGRDGLSILGSLRKLGINTPVILLNLLLAMNSAIELKGSI